MLTPPLTGFVLAPASLTVAVPPVSNQDNAVPYSGTVAITVIRGEGFTGEVALSLDPAMLPAGVHAAFTEATIPAGATQALLEVQAGYATPSLSQVFPVQGTYTIPISASSPQGVAASGTLTLALVQEAPDFALSFFTVAGHAPTVITNLNLAPGAPVSVPLEAYWIKGAYTQFGPVALTLEDVPPFLDAGLDGQPVHQMSVRLNDAHTLTLQALPGLQAGILAFRIRADFQGITHVLPVVATFSPAPFCIRPPLAPGIQVAPGQSLTFPLHLWHDDTFFAPGGGADPEYQGQTLLAVDGALPPGLDVHFSDSDPTGRAAVTLVVTAGPGASPGTYSLRTLATRDGISSPLELTVRVSAPADAPAIWIQDVEWGQTILDPWVRLVGGKAALLRVQLLADRTGLPSPPVTAIIQSAAGDTLFNGLLPGPAQVPVVLEEGDLTSSFTLRVPGEAIQPGMRLTLQAGAQTRVLTPAVDPGATLELTLVPVVQQGLMPSLPPDGTLTAGVLAIWPLQGVHLTHRAPYTTATVLPQPADPLNGAGWAQLLGEVAALRIADGASSTYFGFLDPGITGPFGWSTNGIARIGEGVGIGIDETQAGRFQNPDPSMDLPTSIMLHELGHTFNLDHAPAGGAGDPQLNYPYARASIGTWGFDLATNSVQDPSLAFDIMSYAPAPRWISDWDYRNAMARLAETGTDPAPSASQDVVSGWVDASGQAHLAPLVRIQCPPSPPEPGPLTLLLDTGSGTRTISFAAKKTVSDLPGDFRPFSFTVPASGELLGAEVRAPGARPQRRTRIASLAYRAQALTAAAADGAFGVRESGGVLQVTWDSAVHPYLNILHEGARRTTLALHLTGGAATLPLAGLPAGGSFVLHFSDGLNTLVRTVVR